MKKALALVLCLVMALLCSCKQNPNDTVSIEKWNARPQSYQDFISTIDKSVFTTEFSDEEVKNAVQKYRSLRSHLESGPANFIAALGYPNAFTEGGEWKTVNGNYYYLTTINYAEFAEKVQNHMTFEWFQKEELWIASDSLQPNTGCFINENGKLMFLEMGVGKSTYTVNKIEKSGNNTYITTETLENSMGTETKITATVGIANVKGKPVVAYWYQN